MQNPEIPANGGVPLGTKVKELTNEEREAITTLSFLNCYGLPAKPLAMSHLKNLIMLYTIFVLNTNIASIHSASKI